jgi:hypothetical protein
VKKLDVAFVIQTVSYVRLFFSGFFFFKSFFFIMFPSNCGRLGEKSFAKFGLMRIIKMIGNN